MARATGLHDDYQELSAPPEEKKLSSASLKPTPIKERIWRLRDFFNLWVGMAVCIPTWMLGSSMIAAGLNIWYIIVIMITSQIAMGVLIVLISVPGARYGIPFPVQLRPSFGLSGGRIPALFRGIAAAGWFGIEVWIGGEALHVIVKYIFPGWANVSGGVWVWFFVFFILNVALVFFSPPAKEMKVIKTLMAFSAPLLLLIGIVFVVYFWVSAGTIGDLALKGGEFSKGELLKTFVIFWVAMMGYWSTVGVNASDFTRFSTKQRGQVWGQIFGLLAGQTLYVLVGVIVTSAGAVLYGRAIWDPVELMGNVHSLPLAIVALLFVVIATLATNVAANAVATNMSLIGLWPKRIEWRTASIITGIIAIAMFPWKLLSDYASYVFTWLIGYQVVLGPIMGILLLDYWYTNKRGYTLNDLYSFQGKYSKLWAWEGFVSLVCGTIFALLGLFIKSIAFVYNNGFLTSMGVSAIVYLLITNSYRKRTI